MTTATVSKPGYSREQVSVLTMNTLAFAVNFAVPGAAGGGSLIGFVLAFMALFIAAGVGNGSTFRMIPIIFRTLRERTVTDPNDQRVLPHLRADDLASVCAARRRGGVLTEQMRLLSNSRATTRPRARRR